MNDVPVSAEVGNVSVEQPEDDGRALTIQQAIDAWGAVPRWRRTNVLRSMWNSEQRLALIAADGSAKERQRVWARETLLATRAARYLLRAIANALDPRPPCETCGEEMAGKRADHVCAVDTADGAS